MIESINQGLREIQHREGPMYAPEGVKNNNRGKTIYKEIRFQKL